MGIEERKDSFIKKMGRALARNTLFATHWIVSRLPYPLFRSFLNIFVALGRPFVKKKQKLAIKNLQIAFSKEKSAKEIQEIATACLNNFARGMIDLIYFMSRPRAVKEKVTIKGAGYLHKALEAGNGAILVGAHFGNFLLMYFRLVFEGYTVNVIMRRTRDEVFEKFISDFRDKVGLKTIYDLPARQCVQQSLKALRKNEVLIILLDQNYGTEGRIFVDFFGQAAATATGPVIFSNRTNAPILPIYIKREEGLFHELVISPPVEYERYEDDQKTIFEGISKITKVLEDLIRRYPHEWGGWMHKRWKSRTWEEQCVIDRMNEQGLKAETLY